MTASAPTAIALPKGGGAMRGIGDTFQPDLHTGTGNYSIPIQIPPGRNGLQPSLTLGYSTGNPNGPFGLGWSLPIPGIRRRTSHGLPHYDGSDVFVLSNAEDLVPVPGGSGSEQRYRPRVEGLFARIVRHNGDGQDYWEVWSREGLRSRYGSVRPADAPATWRDPAAVSDPAEPKRILGWLLSETVDTFGNRVEYEYEPDPEAPEDAQRYLAEIRYVDYGEPTDAQFLVHVAFAYESRPDPISDRRGGFFVRTGRRCSRIEVRIHAAGAEPVLTRTVHLGYASAAGNAVSLLSQVRIEGHDGAASEELPPLELGYSRFQPGKQRYVSFSAPERALPDSSLANPSFELVDLFGEGLPSVLQMEPSGRRGAVRFWRNAGRGRLELPRAMRGAPAGVGLADRGVQLADMDGDGRADLLVTTREQAGYYPLTFDGRFDARGFVRYQEAPPVSLEDPDVRLVDLDGDGIVDVLRTASSYELYYNDGDGGGWRRTERRAADTATVPDAAFSDPAVKVGDMTGDGLADIVLVRDGRVQYWPYLGNGRWGRPAVMGRPPRFASTVGGRTVDAMGYDPRRLLLGDVDGDGCADLVYVGDGSVTVWLNQSGVRFADPVTVRGTPGISDLDAVRLADMLGNGTGGVLWTYDAGRQRRSTYKFLDLTGAVKPYLLTSIDNHMGARTTIEYAPSTRYSVADRDAGRPWRTTLPFPVHVVARMTVEDAFSDTVLTTEFTYHHGYWDGGDREFRGFGRVDQRDALSTSTGDHWSPPTETRTWFHLGPVGPERGAWQEIDLSSEFWAGDAPLLPRPTLPALERRKLRDAVRALRGRVLRTELFAHDGTPRSSRPLTVGEQVHASTVVADGVYFSQLIGERTTTWERGDDPLTRVTFTGGYDDYGQPTSRVEIGAPRRGSGDGHLATQTSTSYARRDDDERYIVDRVARQTTYEVVDEGAASVLALYASVLAGDAPRNVIGETLTFYDGPEFEGLPLGEIGDFGAPVRTDVLVLTEELLAAAYGASPPPYLAGAPSSWPSEYPASFRQQLGPAGARYVFRPGGPESERGYYADQSRRSYDFHVGGAPARGLVRAELDARGGRTNVAHDAYGLLPTTVENPAGLIQAATYDYRVLAPTETRDANENRTRFEYGPLGLVASVAVMGKEGEDVGDTPDQPGTRFSYDLTAGARGEPVSVHTLRRKEHRWAVVQAENERRAGSGQPPLTAQEIEALFPPDESQRFPERFLETREISDGFGRLLQTRAKAEEMVLGDPGRGDSGLSLDQQSPAQDAVGQVVGDRVVVTGAQTYDNKGRVVERYEPFFSRGFAYAAPTAAELGFRTTFEYDALGRTVRTIAPDGSEHLVVRGIPASLDDPRAFAPSAWVTYVYDANDNAGRTHASDGAAYRAHWNTPASTLADALGRTVESVERLGTRPEDLLTTRSTYDIRGKVLSVTDPAGRSAVAAVYDHLNRAVRTERIDSGTRRLVFDAAGNTLESRDAKGALTLSAFDALNRPVRMWARDRTGEPVTLRERIEYGDVAAPRNARGRVLEHFDEAGLLIYPAYDFKGNVLVESRRVVRDDAIVAAQDAASGSGWAGAAFRVDWEDAAAESVLEAPNQAHETSTRYDALNRPTSVRYPRGADGARSELRPGYDRSGALQRIELDGDVAVERVAYDARGQRILIAYGCGLMTRYAYDPRTLKLRRMRTERYAAATPNTYRPTGPPLQDFAYEYDLRGNMLRLRDRTPGSGVAPLPDALDREFVHDALYRLTRATGRECDAASSPPWSDTPRCSDATRTRRYTEDYAYDAAGNVASLRHLSNGSGFTRTFAAAPGTNRLETLTVGSQSFAYAYDDAGNLLRETESRLFEWDHADRLQTFRQQASSGPPSVFAQYLYDAFGKRVKMLARKGPGVIETTVYVGAGFESRSETRGSTMLTGSTVHVLDGAQRILEVRRGAAPSGDTTPPVKYHLGDHLGSSNVVTDSGGTIVNREEYTPYGETSYGSYARKRYRYSGKERDEDSALAYHGARYYAPWLVRWLSCDPAGTADHLNPYQFVSRNPLRSIDDDGQAETDVDRARQRTIRSVERRSYLKQQFQERNLEKRLGSMPQPQPVQRASGPPGAVQGKIPVYGPELPDDFTSSGLPLGASPGPTLPNMGSRAGQRVGIALDIIGEINRWHQIRESFKEFDKSWSQFWFQKWYGKSIRIIRGRTPDWPVGVEGRGPGLEASRPGKPSPYIGRFVYIDEAIARISTEEELGQLKDFLTTKHYAWKTNRPENIARGGMSVLTMDRAAPLSDEEFRGIMWNIDLKIDLIRRNELVGASALGDYPVPQTTTGGRIAS
jgi:RHS repeat-associated protein